MSVGFVKTVYSGLWTLGVCRIQMCLLSGRQWVTALWRVSRSHRVEPCVCGNNTDGPGWFPAGDAGLRKHVFSDKTQRTISQPMLIVLAKCIVFTVEDINLCALHALWCFLL